MSTLDVAIMDAFAANSRPLDAADVVLHIEKATGDEQRLAPVFNRMLEMVEEGILEPFGFGGGGKLYVKAVSTPTDTGGR
jgi:Fe2+ or Zn2+ uptake regulation protein